MHLLFKSQQTWAFWASASERVTAHLNVFFDLKTKWYEYTGMMNHITDSCNIEKLPFL